MAITLASGARLELFATLDSTSLEARRRVEAGRLDSVFIVALEQTAGYGRRGSPWRQAAGDFAGTLLFQEQAAPETIGQLSFVAGLAVADAVATLAPSVTLSLKWPNDLLAGRAKLAGILLELVDGAAAKGAVLSLGVGVNIVTKPEGLEYPAARLLDCLGDRPAPAATDVAAAIDAAFYRWRGTWRREGFQPVREAWLEKAYRLGETIRVRLPDGEASGVFRDLDPTGALVLDCDGSARLISAGAVLWGRGD